jgi:hypothetical protein
MSTLLSNFKKSGDLADESNHAAGDLQFWTCFAKSQPKWLWIYLAWDRGNNVPAWSVSLLPSEEQLDIASHEHRDGPVSKKPRATSPARNPVSPAPVVETEFSQLMKVSSEYCKFALATSLASTNTASSNENLKVSLEDAEVQRNRASHLGGLLSQLKSLNESLLLIPEDLRDQTNIAIRKVADKIANWNL